MYICTYIHIYIYIYNQAYRNILACKVICKTILEYLGYEHKMMHWDTNMYEHPRIFRNMSTDVGLAIPTHR